MKSRRLMAGMVFPIYAFTLLFVLFPIVYMIVISFMSRAEVWGFVNDFTLDNYKQILEPINLRTFGQAIPSAIFCPDCPIPGAAG